MDGLYAAGSYSQSVGIYDETNHELCLKLTGIQGGVTQVIYVYQGIDDDPALLIHLE